MKSLMEHLMSAVNESVFRYKDDNWNIPKNDELYSMEVPTDKKLIDFGQSKGEQATVWSVRTSGNVFELLAKESNMNYGTYLEYWCEDLGWFSELCDDTDEAVLSDYMEHDYDADEDGGDGSKWTDFLNEGKNKVKLVFINPKNLTKTDVQFGIFADYPKKKEFIDAVKKEMEKQNKKGLFLYNIITEIDPSAFSYE